MYVFCDFAVLPPLDNWERAAVNTRTPRPDVGRMRKVTVFLDHVVSIEPSADVLLPVSYVENRESLRPLIEAPHVGEFCSCVHGTRASRTGPQPVELADFKPDDHCAICDNSGTVVAGHESVRPARPDTKHVNAPTTIIHCAGAEFYWVPFHHHYVLHLMASIKHQAKQHEIVASMQQVQQTQSEIAQNTQLAALLQGGSLKVE